MSCAKWSDEYMLSIRSDDVWSKSALSIFIVWVWWWVCNVRITVINQIWWLLLKGEPLPHGESKRSCQHACSILKRARCKLIQLMELKMGDLIDIIVRAWAKYQIPVDQYYSGCYLKNKGYPLNCPPLIYKCPYTSLLGYSSISQNYS